MVTNLFLTEMKKTTLNIMHSFLNLFNKHIYRLKKSFFILAFKNAFKKRSFLSEKQKRKKIKKKYKNILYKRIGNENLPTRQM